ncbi:MAG TPA: phenylalanine--tRNA ligase subunit alpha [Thermotogota bacterium]|nr:phenylalanine--tRNA ligase subunit alpha [Thermotogota bacterium]HPJ87610.1 phenylalanine--tRNA ligase subunit alpha [Thermotogota bacterium]HPR94815.1 phenylalanine--tRNA ligase subunit alpha [Thermotogota bacterium]
MDKDIFKQLKDVQETAVEEIKNAKEIKDLDELRIKYLGKKGVLTTNFLKRLGEFDPGIRPQVGKETNICKAAITECISGRMEQLSIREKEKREKDLWVDISRPGSKKQIGFEHLVRRTQKEIEEIFISLGYSVKEGPEVEHVFYNFEALNTPDWHPARDEHDSFYLKMDEYLLRTHTSPVQIRTMQEVRPPIAIIAPGKVYRSDYDATHLPMFHQAEGLFVDKNVSVANLKGTLEHFMKELFGKDVPIRLRPSFFPFTEPSFEVDLSWKDKYGNILWLEVLGAGMVDPNVFKAVGYDPEVWTGFAFGVGIERLTMLKYGLTDIRDLVRGDIRFLRQEL